MNSQMHGVVAHPLPQAAPRIISDLGFSLHCCGGLVFLSPASCCNAVGVSCVSIPVQVHDETWFAFRQMKQSKETALVDFG